MIEKRKTGCTRYWPTERNAVGLFQEYWILRTKVRCHTVKQHSQNPIRSKQQCTVCSLHLFRFPLPKNLRCFCWQVHIIAIARTWESIWRKWELGNPIGAPQLGRINTYTAHTLLFFQLRSTLSNRPNWGSPIGVFSLARAIQSDPIGVTTQLGLRPNWGAPIGADFLIENLS